MRLELAEMLTLLAFYLRKAQRASLGGSQEKRAALPDSHSQLTYYCQSSCPVLCQMPAGVSTWAPEGPPCPESQRYSLPFA